MSLTISGKKFYRTRDAIDKIGVSRSTLFRWIKDRKVSDSKHKDRRGWRLFTEDEIEKIINFKNYINVIK